MNALVLHFLVFTMAGWIHRGQQQVIDYLREENGVLRQQRSRTKRMGLSTRPLLPSQWI